MENRIRELRKERGLTLKQLSEKVGISNQALSFYERGKRSPKIENWKKLAYFFGVRVKYLQGYGVSQSEMVNFLKSIYIYDDWDEISNYNEDVKKTVDVWYDWSEMQEKLSSYIDVNDVRKIEYILSSSIMKNDTFTFHPKSEKIIQKNKIYYIDLTLDTVIFENGLSYWEIMKNGEISNIISKSLVKNLFILTDWVYLSRIQDLDDDDWACFYKVYSVIDNEFFMKMIRDVRNEAYEKKVAPFYEELIKGVADISRQLSNSRYDINKIKKILDNSIVYLKNEKKALDNYLSKNPNK